MKTRILLLNDCKRLKIIYVNCDLRNEFGSNLHNNEQVFLLKLNLDLCDINAVLYQQGAGRYVGSW